MQRYYVARKGSDVIMAYLDEHGALYLHEKGYELAKRPFDTREEAEAEKRAWLEELKKRK
jgi:FAD/FMN-containing dehydrogenase